MSNMFKIGEEVEVKLSLVSSMLEVPIPYSEIWKKHVITEDELNANGYIDFLVEFNMIRKIHI